MQCILEYIAIALMVLNIVGYAVNKSISCIALFGVGAYIARCFSKNLTINIFAGLLVSNVFFGCSSIREGWNPISMFSRKIKELKASGQAKIDLEREKLVKEIAATEKSAKDKVNAAEAKAENTATAAEAKAENTANAAKAKATAAEAKVKNTANEVKAGFANRDNFKNHTLGYSLY